MPFPAFNSVQEFTAMAGNQIQQFTAYLTGFLQFQHKDDGSHGAVTADSVAITGALTVGGATTGTGAATYNANVKAKDVEIGDVGSANPTDGVLGPGMRIYDTTGTTPAYDLASSQVISSNYQALTLMERGGGFVPLQIVRDISGSAYWMGPGKDSPVTHPVDLGTAFYASGARGKYQNAYLSGSVFELGRGVGQGLWQAYTPTLTNLTLGNGTKGGTWAQVGNVTCVEVNIVFGSTSSITGNVIVSLPTSNTNMTSSQILGDVTYFDSSAGQLYQGQAHHSSATEAVLRSAGSPLVLISSTVPMTWATSDEIWLRCCYRNV
jgi:hypothetical protein